MTPGPLYNPNFAGQASVLLSVHNPGNMKCAVAIVLAMIGVVAANPVGWGGIGPVILPSAVSVSSSVINHGLSLPVIKPIITAPIITAPIIKTPIISAPIIRAPIVSTVGLNGLGLGGLGLGGLGLGWNGLGLSGLGLGKGWH